MDMKISSRMDLKKSFKQKVRNTLPPSLRNMRSKIRLIRQADLYQENSAYRWIRALKFISLELMGCDTKFTSPDGLTYVSMPNNYSSFVTCAAGARDPEIWRFISKTLKPGSIFVDAGANIGTYTLPASKLVGTEGRVIAFEAHPKTFGYLERNLALNQIDNATALNMALGDECGFISMEFNDSNPGETHVSKKNGSTVDVTLTTIDMTLARLKIYRVDYLKIDVEGFEHPVIRGASQAILRNKNIIIQTELEQKHAERYGYRISETCEALNNYGFKPYRVEKNGDIDYIESGIFGDVIWMRG